MQRSRLSRFRCGRRSALPPRLLAGTPSSAGTDTPRAVSASPGMDRRPPAPERNPAARSGRAERAGAGWRPWLSYVCDSLCVLDVLGRKGTALRHRKPAAAYTRLVARLRTDATRASEAMKALLGIAAARNLRMSRMKVAKLLYLADLRSVEHDGVAGSGVVWQWRHYGPFSNSLKRVENALVANGDIEMDVRRTWYGSKEYRLAAPPLDVSSVESAGPHWHPLTRQAQGVGDACAAVPRFRHIGDC